MIPEVNGRACGGGCAPAFECEQQPDAFARLLPEHSIAKAHEALQVCKSPEYCYDESSTAVAALLISKIPVNCTDMPSLASHG
jgi:hypothetical protein